MCGCGNGSGCSGCVCWQFHPERWAQVLHFRRGPPPSSPLPPFPPAKATGHSLPPPLLTGMAPASGPAQPVCAIPLTPYFSPAQSRTARPWTSYSHVCRGWACKPPKFGFFSDGKSSKLPVYFCPVCFLKVFAFGVDISRPCIWSFSQFMICQTRS